MNEPNEISSAASSTREPDAAALPAPWIYLRQHTSARIALGRSGGSLPTRALLDFNLDQALARDAVHATFDADSLAAEMRTLPGNFEVLRLNSAATNRTSYLQRPDLGRKLSPESISQLRQTSSQETSAIPGGEASSPTQSSIAIMVSDGLSAVAAQSHAMPVLRELLPRLTAAGVNVASLAVIRFGRVGIMDKVGAALGTTLALILLGERPGLGAPDSLSAYFTLHPSREHTDADRNCVSNIRDAGLTPTEAAIKLAVWLTDSLTEKRSGVMLKEPASAALERIR